MLVQLPDTKAQPKLDCYNTTRIGFCSIQEISPIQLTLLPFNSVAISKYNFITGLALNYISFKYKYKSWTYAGVGNLLVTAIANDVIARTQQIGDPLKGTLRGSRVSMTSGSTKHLSKQIGPAGLV